MSGTLVWTFVAGVTPTMTTGHTIMKLMLFSYLTSHCRILCEHAPPARSGLLGKMCVLHRLKNAK
jgi:hypothetical protein